MTGAMTPGLPAGYRLIELEDVDSTNAEALRRAAGGAGDRTVICAARQSAGRGRKGATWISPPGNLYASLIVTPPPGRMTGQLAFVAALAAGESIRNLASVDMALRYKWPNDLMLAGRKLGGILIEGGPRGLYVVGLGVNVASAPDSGDFAAAALNHHLHINVEPLEILTAFCHQFDHWCGVWRAQGFAPVRAAWLERAAGLDRPIEARLPGETVRGVFAGLDADGALLLDLADGGRREITAGAIYFAEAENASCC